MHSTVGGLGGRSAPPAPSGWTAQRVAAVFRLSLGFLTLVTAGLVAGAVWAFIDGQPGAGVLLSAGAIYVGHVVGFSYAVRRYRGSGPPVLADGVRFRYSIMVYYWLVALLVLTELALLLVIVVSAASATPLGVVLAAIITAGGVAIGWFLAVMLRLAPGEVVLSPDGVHHRSLTFTYFVPWHSIVSVAAQWVNTPVIVVRAAPTEDTRLRRYTGRFGTAELRFLPFMVIRAYWLGTDAATVYHALAFYLANPDLRAELGTRAGLDRITEGRAVSG